MGVSAVVRQPELTVEPGRDARSLVSLRNTGSVVDQFTVTVVGSPADWAVVKPDVVNLLPNEEVVLEVRFAPPRSHEVPSGEHHFALRMASREDPAGSVVREGTVTVAEFEELTVDIVPRNSEGKRKGKHTLAIDNTGNHPLSVDVTAANEDDKLTFRMRPHTPLTRPGTTTFVKVRTRPRKYTWRGLDKSHVFVVTATPEIGPAIPTEAKFLQKPMLPRRLLVILGALVLLLLFLLIWLSRLLQDRPESAAGLRPSTTPTTSASVPTTTPAAVPPPAASPPPSAPGPGPGPGNAGPAPVRRGDFTIRAVAYPGVGAEQLFSYVVPEGRTVRLAAVTFSEQEDDENGDPLPPDTGRLRVLLADEELTAFDLAAIDGASRSFDGEPAARGGEVVALAITCANTNRTCTTTATFAFTMRGG